MAGTLEMAAMAAEKAFSPTQPTRTLREGDARGAGGSEGGGERNSTPSLAHPTPCFSGRQSGEGARREGRERLKNEIRLLFVAVLEVDQTLGFVGRSRTKGAN